MIELDGNHLTLNDLVEVAYGRATARLSEGGRLAVARSRACLQTIAQSGKAVYGINTGFGIFAERRIADEDSARLSRNLILSHAVGTGPAMPREVVRAAMLVRANTLAKGYSGVRVELIETLLAMLERGVTPIVPSQGSLGSSGDLGPLSHLALVFTTDENDREQESGLAEFNGQVMSGKAAMSAAGLQRLILGPKEGLALNNGATFTAAMAALSVCEANYLLDVAEWSLAMSLEAMLGCGAAFDVRLHQAREQVGQIFVAQRVLEITQGSTLLNAAGRVQDAYSLRCAPQVQGAVRDTVEFVKRVVEREINAATDNPLLFDGEAISGGNFHGEPIGIVMDYLGIALAELAAIAERRVFRLTDGKLNTGLPAMLVDHAEAAGLNSGLMMPQYTAASLVLENQTLAHPDTVHSLPTSGEQEDHNANATTAARHTMQILENVRHVLAIELYTAARALDLRLRQMPEARLGRETERVYRCIRQAVPYQAGDAWWGPEIECVKELLVQHEL
jgi:histidine ammonia-lyase